MSRGVGLEASFTRTILDLEDIDTDLFRGKDLWRPYKSRGTFGGQVVGQALVATGRTVPEGFHVHSLHSYFVRPGDSTVPILYHVDRVREGSSFCTRSVKATQKGKAIFSMQVSYHKDEDGSVVHQFTMPNVKPPDQLQSFVEFLRELKDGVIPENYKRSIEQYLTNELPVELKPTNNLKYLRTFASEPNNLIWIKARGHLGPITNEKENNLHRCAIAHISDYALLGTALLPLGPYFKTRMMASLDHSMWFHAPFRADEWMLYEVECPKASHGRALVHGKLWRQDGVLAVSVAQEGVIRGEIKSKL